MAVTTSQIIEVFSLMSCLKKKKKKRKKNIQKRSLEKKRRRYTKHCPKKQRNMKSQETKHTYGGTKNMKQNMAVTTSQ